MPGATAWMASMARRCSAMSPGVPFGCGSQLHSAQGVSSSHAATTACALVCWQRKLQHTHAPGLLLRCACLVAGLCSAKCQHEPLHCCTSVAPASAGMRLAGGATLEVWSMCTRTHQGTAALPAQVAAECEHAVTCRSFVPGCAAPLQNLYPVARTAG